MKRFWTVCEIAPADMGGWMVMLDGKALRLPSVLVIESRALAEAIAQEWQQAGVDGKDIAPPHLPLTGLAGTVCRIEGDAARYGDSIARYGESDLLCYRVATGLLAEQQARLWQPWLDWAARELGALLCVTDGIAPVAQSAQALAALRAAVAGHDAYGLAALGVMVPALGSLVLGLALTAGKIEVEEACRLASLEECFQAEKWGEDQAAMERLRLITAEVEAAVRFLGLNRSKPSARPAQPDPARLAPLQSDAGIA